MALVWTWPAAALGFIAVVSYDIGAFWPVLDRDSVTFAKGTAAAAVVALIGNFVVASRDSRLRTTHLLEGLPLSARIGAKVHPAGVVVDVIFATTALLGAVAWYRAAAGRVDVGELAIGIALVVLAALAGQAIGAHTDRLVWPLLALGLGAAGSVAVANADITALRWFALFVDIDGRIDYTVLLRRPAWIHAGYVASLSVAVYAGASARYARQRAYALAAAALAAAVVLGAAQTWLRPGPTEADAARLISGQSGRSCNSQELGYVLCLYDDFEPWAPRIQHEVSAVLAAIPHDPDPERSTLTIAQSVPRVPPGAYGTSFTLEMNRLLRQPPVEDVAQIPFTGLYSDGLRFDFRAAVAAWAVGLPSQPRPPSDFVVDGIGGSSPLLYCDGSNQARSAVLLYLVARDDSGMRNELEWLVGNALADANTYKLVAGGSVLGPSDGFVALEMLANPRAADAALAEFWPSVRSGTLTTTELASTVGAPLDRPSSPGTIGGVEPTACEAV